MLKIRVIYCRWI